MALKMLVKAVNVGESRATERTNVRLSPVVVPFMFVNAALGRAGVVAILHTTHKTLPALVSVYMS